MIAGNLSVVWSKECVLCGRKDACCVVKNKSCCVVK